MKTVFKNYKVMIFVIIIIGFLFATISNYMSSKTFKQSDVPYGDIKFYGRDSCPFCVKMKKQLKEDSNIFEKMEYVDIELEEGFQDFQEINGNGVPHFVCNSTGKSSTGFKPTMQLLDDLGL